ncbi:MAG: RICIN domain-containing protein [Rhodospirillales bacterium]|nr:RICIN domain-containing protein [Acetobacter sp.]
MKITASGGQALTPPNGGRWGGPVAVAVDAAGNLYVTDALRAVFRMAASDGSVMLVAGMPGVPGNTGDGGPATAAHLNDPGAIVLKGNGSFVFADRASGVVRTVGSLSALVVFPDTIVGSASTDGVTVSNNGNVALPIPTPFPSLATGPFSTVASGGTTTDCSVLAGAGLLSGASCSLTGQFAPTHDGSANGFASLTVGPVSARIAFTGNGLGTAYDYADGAFQEFGYVVVGSASATKTLTVTNSGTGALSMGTPVLSGGDAADFVIVSSTCPAALPGGGSQCAVVVQFRPSKVGAESTFVEFPAQEGRTHADLSLGVQLHGEGAAVQSAAQPTAPAPSAATPVVGPVPAGAIYLTNFGSARALDVTGMSVTNGAPVQQYDFAGTDNQVWAAVVVEPGFYKIVNRRSGKVLDVIGASSVSGVAVQQWTYQGTDNQKWGLRLLADGTFAVLNKKSGKALEVATLGAGNGAPVDQATWTGTANQKWELTPFRYYVITNKATGGVLDVDGASYADMAPVQSWHYHAGANQQWIMAPAGGGGSFKILNRLSGKALEARMDTDGNGEVVQQFQYSGTANQLWYLRPEPGGYVAIVNRENGRVLDVPTPVQPWSPLMQLWDFQHGNNQLWTVTEVVP